MARDDLLKGDQRRQDKIYNIIIGKGIIKDVSNSTLFNIPSSWDINTFPEDRKVIAGDKPDIEKTESMYADSKIRLSFNYRLKRRKKEKEWMNFLKIYITLPRRKGLYLGQNSVLLVNYTRI